MKRRRIFLRSERIRTLASPELQHAHGGEVAWLTNSGCPSINVRCWSEAPCADTVNGCPATATGV